MLIDGLPPTPISNPGLDRFARCRFSRRFILLLFQRALRRLRLSQLRANLSRAIAKFVSIRMTVTSKWPLLNLRGFFISPDYGLNGRAQRNKNNKRRKSEPADERSERREK